MQKLTSILGLMVLTGLLPAPSVRAGTGNITPSIAVEGRYSDNIFFDSRDSRSDFITRVSPGIEFSERTERLSASFKARLDSLFYLDNNDLNATDQDYRGTLRYGVTQRANLFAAAGYTHDSQVDRDIGDTGLLQGVSTRKRYSWQAGGDYALSEMMAVQLAYSGASDDYANPADYDLDSHGFSGSLSRDISALIPSTVGRFSVAFNSYEQTNEQAFSFPLYTLSSRTASKVKNYSATIGGEHQWDEQISLFADIGWRYTDSTWDYLRTWRSNHSPMTIEDPFQQTSSASGLTGMFGGSWRGELSNANLTVSQEVSGASGTTSGATDRTIFRGTIGRLLNEKSRVDMTAEYYINTSVQDDLAFGRETDERTLRLNPRVGYQLSRILRVEVAYVYEQVDDREYDRLYERNSVWGRLSYQYPLFE